MKKGILFHKFDNSYFEKNQRRLLWIANCWFLKWILGLHKLPRDLKIEKIDKVYPSSLHWKTGKHYKKKGKLVEEWKSVCFSRPRFAEALSFYLSPVWIICHCFDILIANNLKPAWNLGFDSLDRFAGAGDGSVTNKDTGGWAAVHDAATGFSAEPVNADVETKVGKGSEAGGFWFVVRGFLPFDTSAIAAGATITAATLNLWISYVENADNDGDDWINVVQTSQPSETTLGTADFDLCGAVSNPTEGATRIDITSIGTGAYKVWTLDATGRNWIKKSGQAPNCGATNGWTCLGVREGHDAINSAYAGAWSAYSQITWSASETGGTANDPYLSITYTTTTAFTQTLTETAILADSTLLSAGFRQLSSDIIILVDTVATRLGIRQTISDILTLVDSLNIRQGFRQTISEIITLVDGGITLVYQMGVSLVETLTLVDTKEIRSYFRQTITSIISLADAGISLAFKIYVSLTDAISLNDTIHIPGTWWSWLVKNVASWTQQSKNNATWTQQTKNSANWTFQNKSDL